MAWWRRQTSDPRHALFDPSLAFGANWRRPVASLASERLPRASEAERKSLALEVEATRTAIEAWVARRWEAVDGNWSESDAAEALQWVAETYPWMNGSNVRHSVSQATYYAWHG